MRLLNWLFLVVRAVLASRRPVSPPATTSEEVPQELHTLLAVLDQLKATPLDRELASRLEFLGFRIMSAYTDRGDPAKVVIARGLVNGAIPQYVAALRGSQEYPMRLVDQRQRYLRLHDACADVARQLGGSASKAVTAPT